MNLVKSWLIKARHDLAAAKKLDDSEYFDVAIYHCQQAAEKALKSFLTMHDVEFPKTHDIRLLVQMAMNINHDIEKLENAAELLTPYATEFRYPGDVMSPSDEEMLEALTKAKEVLDFITLLLKEELK